MGVYHFLSFPDGKRKALTLSYDDGYRPDKKLIEILDRYGIKCTFNLPSWMFERANPLSPEEVREIYGGGNHEVAIHLSKHTAPGKAPLAFTAREAGDNRRDLERIFGTIVSGMAYPDSGISRMTDGRTAEEVKTCLSMLGISYARTSLDQSDGERYRLPQDFLEWHPTCHHTNPNLMELAQAFLEIDIEKNYLSDKDPLLFSLWGHSWEFDKNGNWDVMERFCQLMGNRDDVWYATNMEIYRYVSAYRSLEYSFDDTYVFNPSSQTVWFRKNTDLYCVRPGETLFCGEK